jgi:hypothetical protein
MMCPPEYGRSFTDPEDYRKVVNFNERHCARPGTEYGWIVDHAKALHADADKDFDALDGKAASIITNLGGGAGLLTITSLAALASGQVDRIIIFAALPAFVLSLAAVFFGLWARRPAWLASAPTVERAVEQAHHYDSTEEAKGALLGQWHLAIEVLRAVVHRKAKWVQWATWTSFFAVCALIVPLIVALCLLHKTTL